MTDESKIKGKALRDFRDAGTEKSFEKGKLYEFGEGAFANYAHAKLIEQADEEANISQPVPSPAPTGDEA